MHTRMAGAGIVGLLGAVILLGTSCFPIPDVEEKVVELVATSSVWAEFQAEGTLNLHEDEVTIAVDDSLDLAELLADAGIDVGEVESISFSGLAYEVVEPDPVPNRQIVGGTITVQRQGGTETDLITDFSAPVVVAGFEQPVALEAAGVVVIDGLLQELLDAVQENRQPANATVTFTVSGTSQPIDQPSNFRWRLRLYVSVVGHVTLDLISF